MIFCNGLAKTLPESIKISGILKNKVGILLVRYHTSRYSMEYRGCSKEYLLRAEINVFFSLYQFSPTKYQDIEKIL